MTQNDVIVKRDKLMTTLNMLWDETVMCPPDGRGNDMFSSCLLWKTDDRPCMRCWFEYLTHD